MNFILFLNLYFKKKLDQMSYKNNDILSKTLTYGKEVNKEKTFNESSIK